MTKPMTRRCEDWQDAMAEITDLRRIGFKGNLDTFTKGGYYHVSAQPADAEDERKLRVLQYEEEKA